MKNLSRFLFFFLGCVLLAAILTPWLYRFVQWAKISWGWYWVDLAKYPFHRYFNRVLQLSILIGIWPLLKQSGFGSLEALGLKAPKPFRSFLKGFAWSLIFMSGYVALLFVMGWQNLKETPLASNLAFLILKILSTACLVGFMEELFFRAYFYRLCQRELGKYWALGINLFIFSIFHYVKPPRGIDLGAVDWSSGFKLFLLGFQNSTQLHECIGGLVVLAAIAFILCWAFGRTRHVYLITGLHAGWVFALLLNSELSHYSAGGANWILGGGDLSQGIVAFIPLTLQWITLKWWLSRRPEFS